MKRARPVDGDDAQMQSNKKAATTSLVDSTGERIMTVESVRREVWLAGGKITMKKLSKLFAINKNAAKDRIRSFLGFVKELCVMEGDRSEGNVLVLKQHYRGAM